MSKMSLFLGRSLRGTALSLALVPGLALLAGCAVESDSIEKVGGESTPSHEQGLIGGGPAAPYHFRSTVGIGNECTAAKVGPRLFLTAAHCVAVGRPGRGEPVPEDFPPNDGVRDDYLPGQQLLIHWGLEADDPEQAEFTIVETSIHPSWWACPLCQDPILAVDGAADIAVIEIAEDTPQIPEARVELDSVDPGTPVVKVGWGCEERTNVDPETVDLGRYKTEDAFVIPAASIQEHNPYITPEQVARVDASYVITSGRDRDADAASLCLGDSGGPLYLADNSDPRIVGVNASYTFRPPSGEPGDLGGVSWTDWHTQTALDSLHDVGQWLIAQGVNTVGGEVPESNCTCPSGCDAVQAASVPVTWSGPRDACYFFENLGYSVNNHSMVQVNLNGQDITNQWVGNWSYPAKRDGGYYLYIKGQKAWSWAQVLN